MSTSNLYTLENTRMSVIILAAAAFFIIFVGGFGVFLVENGHPGANITQYSDAVWWAVVTLATVGYGDYYPVTALGRIIAIFMMISGVGIFALMVATFARRRLQKAESKLRSVTKPDLNLLGQETKTAIRTKVDGIETLTEEDFDTLIVEIKNLRLTLLEGSKILKCSRCGIVYHNKPKFCSNCGLALNHATR
ncbi:MAG TPA: potassium channel family protein [Nitrososphaeraceae archaeon]|nr:potassium channel family protein [Nitrososphaeraceae archaeon]